MANTLEVSLALKASGFRSEVNAIKKDNQLLKAEFDKLASSVDKFEDTLEGKQAKLKLVTKEYENAKRLVEIYKKQVEEAGKVVESANKKFNDQQKELSDAKAYVEKYKNATGDTAKVVAETEARIAELEKELNKQAKAVSSANGQYQNMQIQLANAERSVNELGSELKDCATDVYNFDGKLSGLTSGLNDVERELDSIGNELVDFGAKMSQVGQGLMMVGDNLTELGKKGISSISSLVKKGAEWDSSMAQTEMVYGNLEKATQQAIDKQVELASAFGLTASQMKSATTEISSYFKAMGMSDDQIASMLPSQSQLIADMAAFADVDIATALGDYKSALQGNHEAVDKYNIAIGESTINESSYAKEIGKTLSQMTEQEKIQARINVMMEHSADYTGLAQQEAGEFTAQLKLLSAKLEEAAQKIGQTLLPVLEPLIEKISQIVDKVVVWVEQNPQLTATMLAVVGVVSALFLVLGPVFSLLGNAAVIFGALSTAAAGAGTTVLGMISASLVPLITTIGTIIGVVSVVAMAIKSNWEAIQEATNSLLETCAPYFEQLKQSFSQLWEACQSVYETVIQPLFQIIGEVIEVCIRFCEPLFIALMTAFQVAFDVISSVWNGIGKPVFEIIMQVIQKVWDFSRPIIEKFAELFKVAFQAISGVWSNVLKPVFDAIVSVIGDIIRAAGPFISGFVDVVIDGLNMLLTPIQWVIDKFKDLFSWIGSVSSSVGNFLSNINPFGKSRSLDIDASLNHGNFTIPSLQGLPTSPDINPLNNVALSGSYYTPRTPASEGLNKVAGMVNRISTNRTIPNQTNNLSDLEAMFEKKMSQMIEAIANIQVTSPVYLDGEEMSNRLDLIAGRRLKLRERLG